MICYNRRSHHYHDHDHHHHHNHHHSDLLVHACETSFTKEQKVFTGVELHAVGKVDLLHEHHHLDLVVYKVKEEKITTTHTLNTLKLTMN